MGLFDLSKLFSMNLTGINSTMVNFAGMNKRVINGIRPEVNDIGREFLGDVSGVTPVVTGQLKRSAYYSQGDTEPAMVDGSVGYTAPYATSVEFRHNMLSDTLNEWNANIRKRIIDAGFQALEQ